MERMEIETTIEFKSLPVHYIKEANGRKCNTVRIVSEKEDKIIAERIGEINSIRIKNTDEVIRIKNTDEVSSKQSFVRRLRDITRFETQGLIIYIFSW
jgi:hypothetical protein